MNDTFYDNEQIQQLIEFKRQLRKQMLDQFKRKIEIKTMEERIAEKDLPSEYIRKVHEICFGRSCNRGMTKCPLYDMCPNDFVLTEIDIIHSLLFGRQVDIDSNEVLNMLMETENE